MKVEKLIALILAAILVYYVLSNPALQIKGSYVSAYEGAKARFYGMYDLGKAKGYTGGAGQRFDTTLFFDPDSQGGGMGNLEGECTPVQIPVGQSRWVPPSWVPNEWWSDALRWNQPNRVFEWEIKEANGSSFFRMEEWLTKWYVSVEGTWDSKGFWWQDVESGKRYRNWEVWFELDISPVWYFENQSTAYFAIAEITLSHIKVDGHDSKVIDVIPESVGSVLPIYLQPFTDKFAPSKNELESFYYGKRKLNPQYFRDKVYTKITLNDFGSQTYSGWFDIQCQADVVTFGFTVVQFVVGEWKVKNIGEIPPDYGRQSKIEVEKAPSIFDWFSNPFNQLWMFFILIVIVIIVVSIFSPGIWTALALRRRKE